VSSLSRVGGRLAPPIAAALVRALGTTLRLRVAGTEDVGRHWAVGHPVIYAVWHGQILMVPWLNERLRASHGARPATVLVSRSRDGEIVARYLSRFGLDSVRGSTSRGGREAGRALVAAVRRGRDVAVVPDGPRGPSGQLQPGVVTLAALTGAPIVPLGVAARRALRLRSWDGFLVPLPFARCAAVFGPPLAVARDADRARLMKDVARGLDEATAAAARLAVA
jgi:lysophospholipid acyltransferase (LPLAT)-like uncharacterized protein